MTRKLLAFKRAPTVDLSLDNVEVEVRTNRVVLALHPGEQFAWFSWGEWADLSRRVAHAIAWVEEHTPSDVTGSSFTVEPEP